MVAAPCQDPFQQRGGLWLEPADQQADQPDTEPGNTDDSDQQDHQPARHLGSQSQRCPEHHSGQDVGRRPQDCSDHVDQQEARDTHIHHAGNGGNDGSNRANEARHEDTLAAVPVEKIDAAVDQPWVTP